MRVNEHVEVALAKLEYAQNGTRLNEASFNRNTRNIAAYDGTKTPSFPEDGKGKFNDCVKTFSILSPNPNRMQR